MSDLPRTSFGILLEGDAANLARSYERFDKQTVDWEWIPETHEPDPPKTQCTMLIDNLPMLFFLFSMCSEV